ncbi:MAG TPA: 4Fe-4S binding protein [Bacillota bacterium]|nr:4Fe-4S binding protein [Bacillota bacterium]
MASASIIKEKCPQDHPCPALSHCPAEAIVQKGYGAPEIIVEKCIECGKCVELCPKGAFRL